MSKYIDIDDVIEHAEVNGEDKDFIRKLTDYLMDAPTIEPKPEWISVRDRLPEWNTRVLLYCEKECYYDYPEPQYVTDWWVQEGSFNDRHGVFVYDSPDIGKAISKNNVVAWMPLPTAPRTGE